MTTRTKWPTIQISTATADFQFPAQLLGWGIQRAFPTPVPQSGQPDLANYLSARTFVQATPWSTGLRIGNNPRFIVDEYNVISMYPNLITLGPLKQTPTWTGGPTSFRVGQTAGSAGLGFAEGQDRLWMLGFGTTADDEPLWYLNGTTWTNATLNADMTGDWRDVVGLIQWGEVLYVFVAQSKTQGGFDILSATASNTPGTTWATRISPAASETGTLSFAAHPVLVPVKASNIEPPFLAVLDPFPSSAVGVQAKGVIRTSGVWAALGTAVNDGGADLTVSRGAVIWKDAAGEPDLFFSTRRALYWLQLAKPTGVSTVNRELLYGNPTSEFTGQIRVHPVTNQIIVTDGPNIGIFNWGPDGIPQIDMVGPESMPPVDDWPWDGVPLEAQGDVTAIAVSKVKPWVYVAKGGRAASRNARIWVYNILEKSWHCIYRNPTAQRAVMALYEFENDLHFLEEQAADGDQDPFYFEDITTNPAYNTSFKYAASGQFETSRNNLYAPLFRKCVERWTMSGDGLSADETVSPTFSVDGGAFAAGATAALTASPSGTWVDSGSIGSSVVDIATRVTLARGTTNTNSPKIHAFMYEYDVVPRKSNGDAFQWWLLRLFLDEKYYGEGSDVESAKDARNRLPTLMGNVTRLKLAAGQDFPVGTEATVKMLPYNGRGMQLGDVRDQYDLPYNEGGYIDVEFDEVPS